MVDLLRQIKPLDVAPDNYVFVDKRGKPINQDKFGQRQFQEALRALKICHRDFYHTRHTFISVMLTHSENPKRIAEYVGNSPEVIYRSYGKWIGGSDGFGEAALRAPQRVPFERVKPKPEPKPDEEDELDFEEFHMVRMVEAGGIEPPSESPGR